MGGNGEDTLPESSGHDPLCPMLDDDAPPLCVCGVIAAVRADERERIAEAIEAFHSKQCGADMKPPSVWAIYCTCKDAARIARGGESDGA